MKSFITIKELREQLIKKAVSPNEILTFYKNRIKKYNQKLNAVLEVFDDATPPAQDSDQPLGMIPYLLKDNICQKGRTTSAGSNILSNYQAPYDATVHKRLKQAGGYAIGRTNMDEFAMGGSGEFSAYGATRNPWDLERTPGGSSSGSASAVAAGLAPFAMGTETGGSVRQPASFCGLVGLYPTYGLHSRSGIIAFTSSTDQPAPITKTVYDNALVASLLRGYDPSDSTSLQVERLDYTQGLDGKLPTGLRIGILRDETGDQGMDSEVTNAFNRAVKQLETLSGTVKDIHIPHLKYGNAVYFILSRAEAASNLLRFDGSLYGKRNMDAQNLQEMYEQTRHDGFGQEVKRRILTGTYALSAGQKELFYYKSLQVRDIIRAEFISVFDDVDVIISPTAPTLPAKLGQNTNDPLAMYLADYFTVPNCVIGTPALSLPCGYSKSGLPIGFQFFGRPHSEELLYKAAYAFEQSTDYHLKNPACYE